MAASSTAISFACSTHDTPLPSSSPSSSTSSHPVSTCTTRTYMQTHAHARARAHTHTRTRTRAHTRMRAHTHQAFQERRTPTSECARLFVSVRVCMRACERASVSRLRQPHLVFPVRIVRKGVIIDQINPLVLVLVLPVLPRTPFLFVIPKDFHQIIQRRLGL